MGFGFRRLLLKAQALRIERWRREDMRREANEGVDPVKADKRDEGKEERMRSKKEEEKIN